MRVIVLGIAVALRKQFAPLTHKQLFYSALLSFLGIFLHHLLQLNGLLTSAAATTVWIVATVHRAAGLVVKRLLQNYENLSKNRRESG